MPEETGTETQAEQSSSTPDLQSELQAARDALKDSQLELQQSKFVQGQQKRQFDQQLQQRADAEQANMSTEDRDIQAFKSRQDELEMRQGLIDYKMNNPEWMKYKDKVDAIINDPVLAQEVAVIHPSGVPDLQKSYTNAQRLVELKELRAAQAAATEAKAGQAQEQNRLKGQATISGSAATASETEESINIEDPRNSDGSPMNSDDMLRNQLVDFDPKDPIKPMHPKR